MKSKKIISGLLALTFVFGGTALPNTVVNNSVSASAATSDAEVDGFRYTFLKDGTVEITGYSGKDTEVEIPAEIDGVAVTSIGYAAFHYNTSIVSVSMPDSITEMKREVFAHCSNLVEVKLSANLTDIGSSSFVYTNPSLVIKCYNGSFAENYALTTGKNFKVLDVEEKTEFPVLKEGQFNSKFHQFRLNWTEVKGAEEYGIAVKLADKWKVQAYTDKTAFTSPKLKSGSKYDMVICAKVNGKWETTDFTKRAFTIAVK